MQRYAHMRRSNVERAFQIHFDDCSYVCQPGLRLSRETRNSGRLKKKTSRLCLLSTTASEVRNDAVALDKTESRRYSVSRRAEILTLGSDPEH